MTRPETDELAKVTAASQGELRFRLMAAAVVVIALALRSYYALSAQVDVPLRGDVLQYVSYAWNLVFHGVFSSAPPGSASVVADAYRGPGYPLLLAPLLAYSGDDAARLVRIAVGVQILLSTATVALVIALARRAVSPLAGLFAGLMTALWPHLVAFADTLLSETWLALWLVVSIVLLVGAERRGRSVDAAAAGVAVGFSTLINPLVLPFGAIAAVLLGRRTRRGLGAMFFVAFAVLPAAWSVRNASLPDGGGANLRLWQNFVQGAWPQYHDAENRRFDDATAKGLSDQIAAEWQAMARDPVGGAQMYAARFAQEPLYYARWYLLQKPYLLWDWRIRIGAGDVNFLTTRNSPYHHAGLALATKVVLERANPLVFLLSALAALALCIESLLRRPARPLGLVATAWFLVYVTAAHALLQAEPRYSIAYRPLQFVLLAAALHAGALALRARRRSAPA